MKKLEKIENIIKEHKTELKKDFNIKRIGIFGSYIRGEQSNKSDLDVLVEFKEPISLLKQAALWNYLSELLRIKIDLVCKRKIRPELKHNILREVVYL
ncbi:MAG: nucleotidyltransferase [Elusimicrobia bacterium RIFOXYD2_FULL_34_15]|nr:MAG: nucleotidyltransferase [Elusimicrobia bacterium RIFOXYD2_FULL_34_15]